MTPGVIGVDFNSYLLWWQRFPSINQLHPCYPSFYSPHFDLRIFEPITKITSPAITLKNVYDFVPNSRTDPAG
jgi:hypothetical protein